YAGPPFYLTDADRALLGAPDDPVYRTLPFYFERLTVIVSQLEALLGGGFDLSPDSVRKLRFIWQNMTRVRGNLNYIYSNGTFPNFDPSTDLSCPPSGGCNT